MKKILSIMLAVTIIIATVPFVVSAAGTDENIVYEGGQIAVTYSFAKDVPEGVPCYLFESYYDPEVVDFKSYDNHWDLAPLVVPHPEYKIISCSAFTAFGPEVKTGDKLVTFTFTALTTVNVDELDFSIAYLELFNNDAVELDTSYTTHTVKIISQGNPPATEPETEPTTEATTTEPATVAPTVAPTTEVPAEATTTEPTPVAPTVAPTTEVPTTEPTTEPTTVPVTTEKVLLFGDANMDGIITIEDATLIQKIGINYVEVDSTVMILADVNNDGRVSIFDVTYVQKYLADYRYNTANVGKQATI